MTVTDADKEKGETTDQNSFFFGFDYSHCEDVTVTGDGLAILKLYYNREIWSIKLHTTPMRDNTTKSEYEALKGNDIDVWLTFSGRYGSLLPDDYPAWEKLNEKFGDEVPEGWTDPNHPENPLVFVNMLWPATAKWNPTSGKISTISYLTIRSFTGEDAVGSHEINLYPFYDDGFNLFSIRYYLQDLDGDFTILDWDREITLPRSRKAHQHRIAEGKDG